MYILIPEIKTLGSLPSFIPRVGSTIHAYGGQDVLLCVRVCRATGTKDWSKGEALGEPLCVTLSQSVCVCKATYEI